MRLFLLLSILPTLSFANVQSGELIKAVEYNNSKFTIGDIKSSILTDAQFATLHGNCWVKLNSSSPDVSISGSDLAALKGISSIKSSAGRVLRAEGSGSESLGQVQEDSFQGHKVGLLAITSVGTGDAYALTSGSAIAGRGTGNTIVTDQVRGFYTDGTNGSPRVSNETRMKNLTINMFVKINHNCN